MLDASNVPPAATALIARRLLNRHSPHEIAEAVEVLIDLLDLLGGEPDSEDDDPDEVQGDEKDAAWVEWHTMRGSQKRGPNILAGHEDGEEDDAAEDDDPGGQYDEDCYTAPGTPRDFEGGAGCPISDPDFEHDGRELEGGY